MSKKEKEGEIEEEKKPPVKSYLAEQRVMTESSDEARELYNKSRFGTLLETGKVQMSLLEALYLLEKRGLLYLTAKTRLFPLKPF